MNVPIELKGKNVLIDIKVVKTQIDYNLLLGHSYMYEMQAIASSVFQLMIPPHDGKIVTIDQLMYYDPKVPTTQEHVLPTINTTIDSVYIASLSIIGPGLFIDAPLDDTFLSLPPSPSTAEISHWCTITSSKISISLQPQPHPQP